MNLPEQHVMTAARHARRWVLTCTCGTAAISPQLGDALRRIPHEARPKEEAA